MISTRLPFWVVAFGVVCSLLSALWIRSFLLTDSVQFVRRSAVHEARLSHGALVLDNSPQIVLEHERSEALESQLSTYADHFPRARENGADPTLDARMREADRLAPRFRQLERRRYIPGTSAFSRKYDLGLPIAGIDLLCIAGIVACGYGSFRRVRLGRCLWCGYDLRASGEHCSECGRPRHLVAGPGIARPTAAAVLRAARWTWVAGFRTFDALRKTLTWARTASALCYGLGICLISWAVFVGIPLIAASHEAWTVFSQVFSALAHIVVGAAAILTGKWFRGSRQQPIRSE